MTGTIDFERVDNIGVLRINRPAAYNAVTDEMLGMIESIIDDVSGDTRLRAMIITGSGDTFCAGKDLKELARESLTYSTRERDDKLLEIQRITCKLIRLPIPTVAALNGVAVGLGLELAIACDIRLAAESSYSMFTEARRGLFQTNGVMFLLPRIVGYGRALEWMLSARRISSEEMATAGLVSNVYGDAEMSASSMEYARRLASNSPLSMKLIKKVGLLSLSSDFESVLDMEVRGMQECYESDYMTEGLNAFIEKREPDFS